MKMKMKKGGGGRWMVIGEEEEGTKIETFVKPQRPKVVRNGVWVQRLQSRRPEQAGDDLNLELPKTSMVVVSEFIGCSSSLSGALRVTPWDVWAKSAAMNAAVSASDDRKHTGHAKHYRHITGNNVAKWSNNFVQDLRTACVAHNRNYWLSVRSGLTFLVAVYNLNLKKLSAENVSKSDNSFWTMTVPINARLKFSSRSSTNFVTIRRIPCSLSVAEVKKSSANGSGHFMGWVLVRNVKFGEKHENRWAGDGDWETYGLSNDFGWMEIANSVMNVYSFLDGKESLIKKKLARS
ncbi:hypothetical protein OSB04_001867 [Centaurea solstitialis]|uniref:Uncharacterized protein n=1 Tax=Centaurea solstitialis TaxID=347529 RepID=A0AA38U2D0_9ASTR|nr:hypothetical protein OSB04_001867 [Centaurea solstitialis]